jgi:hypothetical protein
VKAAIVAVVFASPRKPIWTDSSEQHFLKRDGRWPRRQHPLDWTPCSTCETTTKAASTVPLDSCCHGCCWGRSGGDPTVCSFAWAWRPQTKGTPTKPRWARRPPPPDRRSTGIGPSAAGAGWEAAPTRPSGPPSLPVRDPRKSAGRPGPGPGEGKDSPTSGRPPTCAPTTPTRRTGPATRRHRPGRRRRHRPLRTAAMPDWAPCRRRRYCRRWIRRHPSRHSRAHDECGRARPKPGRSRSEFAAPPPRCRPSTRAGRPWN